MARPPKNTEDALTGRTMFRHTPEEGLTFKMNAAASGLSVSDLCRRRMAGLAVTPPAANVASFSQTTNRPQHVNRADRICSGQQRKLIGVSGFD